MSAPLAASVAALIWSQNPDWTASQVKQKLLDSVDPIDSFICNTSYAGKLGTGRINAYRAVSNIFPGCNDVDGDGFYAEDNCGTEQDCDDNDFTVNPESQEVCGNGIDENCDGYDDVCPPVCTDMDGDGYSVEGSECGEQRSGY
jgi:hypothetical protein